MGIAIIMISLLLGVFLAIFGLYQVFCIVTVDGYSMQPTLEPGDRLLVLRRFIKRFLRKQQIVVLTPYGVLPATRAEASRFLFSGQAFIKRLTALGNDTQDISPEDMLGEDQIGTSTWLDDGQLYIMPENREYKYPLKPPARTSAGGYCYHIPTGYGFVLSDNRAAISDSRAFGPIPIESVLGIVIGKLS